MVCCEYHQFAHAGLVHDITPTHAHTHTHTHNKHTHTCMHTHTHTHTHTYTHTLTYLHTRTYTCHAAYSRVLVLSKQDEEVLLNGGWLTATHIAAVHNLRKTFPNQKGLNDTSVLSEKLKWPSNPTKFVQIIHLAGCHWACLSNL